MPNYLLGNHDVHRVASRVGPEQARLGMMLLLTLRGTPTLYYGDEIGMHDVEVLPNQVHDPYEKNIPGVGLGRDPERTPMQWDAGPRAGFCRPDVEPWLPIASDYSTINVAVESEDPRSMLALTRALIQTRRTTPALSRGAYCAVHSASSDCFLFVREDAGHRVLVALNFSDADQTVSAGESGRGSVLLSTRHDRDGEVELASLSLRPNEGLIVALSR